MLGRKEDQISMQDIEAWLSKPLVDQNSIYALLNKWGCRLVKAYLKQMGVDLSGVIFHQDQGSVYTSYEYVGELVKDGIKISYSRVATPSDNPEMESFFGRLKDEWADVFAAAQSGSEVIELINKALSYYNEKRRHSSIEYLAPDDFIKRELAAVTV